VLRPRTLDEYIGQDRVREQLHVAITAAKQRGEALDRLAALFADRRDARRACDLVLRARGAGTADRADQLVVLDQRNAAARAHDIVDRQDLPALGCRHDLGVSGEVNWPARDRRVARAREM